MGKNIKISIITVCYNSANTIEDTFKSIEAQTYENIEYIVVDGVSKDNTLEIAEKYKNIITHLISEKDSGLYDAMNKGITLASGGVIGILNSDDLYCDNNAIEKVMSIFNENEDLDSVYADIFYVDKNNTDKIVRQWNSGKQKSFKNGWHPAHPTLFIKKEIYDRYGLFDLNFKIAADFEIMLRFLEKNQITTFYLPEHIMKMRLGGESNKSIKNIINQNVECLKAFEKNNVKVNKFIYPIKRLVPKLLQYNN